MTYCTDRSSGYSSLHPINSYQAQVSDHFCEENDTLLRVVPVQSLDHIEQRSEMVCTGKQRGFTGYPSASNGQLDVNGSDSFGSQNGHCDSIDRDLEERYNAEQEFQRKAAEQHERKRKYLFTQEKNVLYERDTDTESNKRVIPPKFRAYSKEDIRERSFVGFNSASKWTTLVFAICGFFYKGFSDITACYQCGFVYKNWQKDEDPILTHIKNQPNCQHIEDLKRKNIDSCKELVNDSENDVEMAEVTTATENLSINQNEAIDPRLICKVCLVNKLEFTIQPCGHLVICHSCCQLLFSQKKPCPVCRGPIEKAIRTLIPE
ncbi:baculoviral IAP repeat-containing protein 7-B-like [Mytilus californianus]|uniref:baculoviral IAP repeat-containing protein 7-B-like n=1 Tax=Mytilus californianus TaxID=6549 RepID=UPI002245B550|nr:baculoviral IAP repeat-containing protein 7-B-like [Mytilus californianus]XP_052086896.1 baculoviral IAP repeat-containing protein 7-B-like [Mytilus californianus]